MARVITIKDDDAEIVARVVVEQTGLDQPPRITSVHLDAENGSAIRSSDLLLLEAFGLSLPTGNAAAALQSAKDRPRPARRPARKSSSAARKALPARLAPEPVEPAAATPARVADTTAEGALVAVPAAAFDPVAPVAPVVPAAPVARKWRKAPTSSELAAAIKRVGMSPKGIAEYYDVPRHTAQAWLDGYRRQLGLK